MKEARVKDIIKIYLSGGLNAVKKYLFDTDLKIFENSWCYKIKRLLELNRFISAEEEIKLIASKFDF